MTYFQFLLIFLGLPLAALIVLTVRDYQSRKSLPDELKHLPEWAVLLAHIVVAVLYTTPWDNYLVATGVWAYQPKRVIGITLGYVPLEEYIFFGGQTLASGLWLLLLGRRWKDELSEPSHPRALRRRSALVLGMCWMAAIAILLSGWKAGTYLSLILSWALPLVMIQAAFGADLLWRRRKLILVSLASVTIYLSAADNMAIRAGTWRIDPEQSTQIFAAFLPMEEAIFFLMTNTLIIFGMILVLSRESWKRAGRILKFSDYRTVKDR